MAKSIVLFLAIALAVLVTVAEARQHYRRAYDSDQQQEFEDGSRRSADIDTTKDSERESDEGHRHHRHHRRNSLEGDSVERSRTTRDPLQEMKEFRRKFLKTVRRLAEESDLSSEDAQILVELFEDNWTEMKVEDRSEWTEDQWQRSKDSFKRRKEATRRQAFEKIEDHEHLKVFFDKLHAYKTVVKATYRRRYELLMIRMAYRSGLSNDEIIRFLVELDVRGKPKGVHYRPGMSDNERAKNLAIQRRHWRAIKQSILKDASESSQENFERFFRRVERYFRLKHALRQRTYVDREGHRMHHRHHRHGLSRFVGHRRSSHRRSYDIDEESTRPSRHYRREPNDSDEEVTVSDNYNRHQGRHRHDHRVHHSRDYDREDSPRTYRHEYRSRNNLDD